MLEPFFGGSHRRFCRSLMAAIPAQWSLLSLPDRHWKWRARGCVLYWIESSSEVLNASYDLIFSSSLVPINELKSLVPSLARVPSLVYCHENQFSYPNQTPKERDFHYAFSEMLTFRAADAVVFNSQFNRVSFLTEAHQFLSRMPDFVPMKTLARIEAKSSVIPLVIDWPLFDVSPTLDFDDRGPLIMWNHRWEHDKGPNEFFEALYELKRLGGRFRLSLCGQEFRRSPRCFGEARIRLKDHLVDAAPLPSRAEYLERLSQTDIVVSTSLHEFFGISMMEATMAGAMPLAPDRLVYPELYPSNFLYSSQSELVDRLGSLCKTYQAGNSLRADRKHLFQSKLDSAVPGFLALFTDLTDQ